jgi:hypothetical protein
MLICPFSFWTARCGLKAVGDLLRNYERNLADADIQATDGCGRWGSTVPFRPSEPMSPVTAGQCHPSLGTLGRNGTVDVASVSTNNVANRLQQQLCVATAVRGDKSKNGKAVEPISI